MPVQELDRLLLYVTAAIGYAVAGYMSKVRRDDTVEFSPVRFSTTVLIGLVAGVIMAAQGDDATQEAYTAAATIAIPIVDKLVNYAMDARGGDPEPTAPTDDSSSTAPTNDPKPTNTTDDSETKYR